MIRTPLSFLLGTSLFCLGVVAESKAAEVAEDSAADAKPRLMVLDLRIEEGVSSSAVRLLNEILLSEVDTVGWFDVMGEADVVSMIEAEQQRQLAGCDDVLCMAEISGALGAEYSLLGSVGALGELYILSLKVIHTSQARVIGRWSKQVAGEPSVLVDAIKAGARTVLSQVAADAGLSTSQAGPDLTPPPGVEEDEPLYTKWWLWTIVGVVTAGAVTGTLLGVTLGTNGGGDPPPAGPTGNVDVTAILPLP